MGNAFDKETNRQNDQTHGSPTQTNSTSPQLQRPHILGRNPKADAEYFRVKGKQMVDYMANYLEKEICKMPPFPAVQPNYLMKLTSRVPPMEAESFEQIMEDVDRVIMPGITHWHHPNFYAYFVAANSYPGMLGEMLSTGLGCIGFTWAASPACTELEVIMMDWLAKMLGLPDEFLSGGEGGGVISNTTSEATLVSLLAARNKVVEVMIREDPSLITARAIEKLVGYRSEEAHSSVERAGLIGMIKMRAVPVNQKRQLQVHKLLEMIDEDIAIGLRPFWIGATLGTTNSCAFDSLAEIGPLCKNYSIWLHVDAAYAGSALVCPEYRYLIEGIEYVDSFVFNAHKWLLVNFDCACVWYRESRHVVNAFNVDPVYLKYKHQGKMPDFRHWGVAFGRRFRALKIWFVVRLYGVRGLQEYIRNHVAMAKEMERLMIQDGRFEIVEEVVLGLVCFRLKDQCDEVNRQYLDQILTDGRIYLGPGSFPDKFFLRLAINYQYITRTHIQYAFNVLCECITHTMKMRENTDSSVPI